MKIFLKTIFLFILLSSYSYSQDYVPRNQYLSALMMDPPLNSVDSIIALKEISLIVPFIFVVDQYAEQYANIAKYHKDWYDNYDFQILTVVLEVTNLSNPRLNRNIKDLMKGGNDWIAGYQYLFDSYYRDSRKEISVFTKSQSFGEFLGFFDTSLQFNSILVDRAGKEIYRFDGMNPTQEIDEVLKKYKKGK